MLEYTFNSGVTFKGLPTPSDIVSENIELH